MAAILARTWLRIRKKRGGGRALQPRVATTCFALIILLAAAVAPAQQANWVDQGRDGVSQTSYFHVPSTTDSSTGISFHRSHASCRFNDVRLVNPPTWLEMVKYNGNVKDGSPGTRFRVRMERGHADDRSLRLSFKAGSTMPTGAHTLTLAAERHLTSPGCSGATAATLTLEYTINIFDQVSWTQQGLQSYEDNTWFRTDELGGLAIDTGLRLHRRSNLCPRVDMSLVGGTEDYLELRAFESRNATHEIRTRLPSGIVTVTNLVLNTGKPLGAGATRLIDLVMDRGSPRDSYVRLYHKAGVSVSEEKTIIVSLGVEVSRSCGFPETVRKQTLNFLRQTVLAAPSQYRATWVSESSESLTPTGPLSPVDARRNERAIATGIFLDRRSSICQAAAGMLLNHTDVFDFVLARGTALIQNVGDYLQTRSGKQRFALVWSIADGGDLPTAGSVLTVSVLMRSDPELCANNTSAPNQTLSFNLTVATPASWSVLTGDATQQAALLQPSLIKASTTPTDTGVRFHRTFSDCPVMDINLTPNPHVEMRLYNGSTPLATHSLYFSDVRMQENHADDRLVGLQFPAGATVPSGVLTITLGAFLNECTDAEEPYPLTMTYKLTVNERWPWRTQSRDNFATQLELSRADLDGAGLVETGLRIHRDSHACQSTNVALAADAPSYLSLRRYTSAGAADGAAASALTGVNMSGTGANDRHVQVMINGGTAITPGATVLVTLTVSPNSSCTDALNPAAQQLVGKVLPVNPAGWESIAGDVATRPRVIFQPSRLRASTTPTDTGLRFHRGTDVCPLVDFVLRNTDYLQLQRYTPAGSATGSAGSSFSNVRMEADHINDRLVGVQFKAGVQVPPGSLTATVVAQPASSCTSARAPLALTMKYELAVTEYWPWRIKPQDSFGMTVSLESGNLTGTDPVPTGLRLQRDILVCSNFDVALAADAPSYLKLRKYQDNGTVDGAAARSLTGVDMSGAGALTRHVRVAIDGGTSFTGLTTLRITMTVATNASCASESGLPASRALVGTLAVFKEKEEWKTLAGDVARRDTVLFNRSYLTATDTGLRFHRGTDACPDVDIALRSVDQLQLQLYNSSGAAVGSSAASFTNVRMKNNDTNDRRVGVLFPANTIIPSGTGSAILTLTATPNASCTNPAKPDALVLTYTLYVGDKWPWRTQARDNFGTTVSMAQLAVTGTNPLPTGLRIHRDSQDCQGTDVDLASASPSYLKLGKYRANGTADGAAARSLDDVYMSGSGPLDRHAEVMVDGGTSFTGLTTLQITLTVGGGICVATTVPDDETLVGKLVMVPPEAWRALSGDVAMLARTKLFQPSALRAAASASDTGLRIHRGTDACPDVDVVLRTAQHLELQGYDASGIAAGSASSALRNVRMQSISPNDRLVGLQFKAGTQVTPGMLTVTVEMSANASCTHVAAPAGLTLTYTLAVLEHWPWRAQPQDNMNSPGQVSQGALTGTTNPVLVGLRLHRDSLACQSVDVALASNAPSYMKIGKYRANGASDGAVARSLTGVNMSGSGATDRHVRVSFDGGANVQVNTDIKITMTITPNATSCTGVGHPPATRLVGTVIVRRGAAWLRLNGDVETLNHTILFQPSTLRTSTTPTDTGLRVHRGTSSCPDIDITLRTTNHMNLQQYDAAGVKQGSPSIAFATLRMENNHNDDRRVGLQFLDGISVTPGMLTLTVEVKATETCAAVHPVPLTLTYTLAALEHWPWRSQAQHNFSVQARFPHLSLGGSNPTPTGLRLHRDARACQSIDVALHSGAPSYLKLRKHQADGTADGAAARSLSGVNMSGTGAAGRHVRVAIDSNSGLAANTTVMVTVTVTPNATACAGVGHPPAQQLVGMAVAVPPEDWSTLAGDVSADDRLLFPPSLTRASNTAIDTGLRLHRGTNACPDVNVTLLNTMHLQLQRYRGGSPTGSAATFFTNVRMQTGNANDRRIGVQFRPGAQVSAGTLTLTLEAKASASCTDAAKPRPLTVKYELVMLENWPWRNQAQDNFSTRPDFAGARLHNTTGAVPTGLRLHRNILVCSSFDVALATGTPSYVKLGSYRTNGTADGAAVRSLAGVNMSGSGALDRHVRVTFDGGTRFAQRMTLRVTLTIATNSSCASQSGAPSSQELVGEVDVIPTETWSALAGDVAARDRILFKPTQIRSSNTAIDTGLRLHRGTSACPDVDVTLRNTTHLELRQYTSSAATGSAATFFTNIRMKNNDTNDRRVGVQFRAGATLTAGPLTLTLITRPNSACTNLARPGPLTLAYTLSVLENWPQRNQSQDNLGTQARIAALSLEGVTDPVPIGLRLHRNIFVCTSFDVALANGTPSYVKLRKYQTNGTADGSAARSLTGVAMPGSGSTDRHVRIAIDGGTSFTQQTTLPITMTMSTNSSCASQSGAPVSHQLVGTVVIVPPQAWAALTGDVPARDRSLFKPSAIRASNSAIDTGLRFHRSTSACPEVDVALRNTTHLELRRYTSSAATGSAATSFSFVVMQNNHANDRRVGVQFRAGATVTPGTLTLTLIAQANTTCTNLAKPRPLTMSYELVVLEDWPLRSQAQDNLGALARLPGANLQASGPVVTGLRLHRNILVCSNFDVALASGAPSYVKLRKYQANGTADGAAARSLTGVNMSGSGAADRHVRVAIDGGTSFTQRTRVRVTMTLSTNSSCASQSGAPVSHELIGTVQVYPPEAWSVLSGDVSSLAQTMLFQPSRMRSANATIDTGLRLHRGTAACPDVNVTLRNTEYLQLQQHSSSAEVGGPATFFTNIRMKNNDANDRRVGVQFRSAVQVPAGRLTLTLIAEANASCTALGRPGPLTLAYELEVRENWPWRTQGQDNLGTQARLAAPALNSTNPVLTGLRLHRDSLACQSTDVALASGSPSYLKLRKYQANGTADGSAARSLSGVNMSGSGSADRHVRIAIDGGTSIAAGTFLRVTLTVTRNSSCTGQGHPPATQLVGTVAIVAAEAWAALAGDVANRDRILFKPSVIGAANSATDTGLRFHRGTTVCPDIDVTLRNTTHLELRQYTSSAATGSAATFFRNLRMQNNHANDRRVGVQFRAGATLTAGPLTLTLIAEANSSCTNPAKQLPLTMAYTLSVQEDWPLRNQGQDNLGTQARLPALSLSGVTGAIPTGLRLHRNIFVCSSFDVALANGTPSYVKLRKYRSNGTADGAAARSLTGVAMPGTGATDRHVRIAIDGGTSFTQQTTLPITMTLSTNSSCANQSGAPASHQLVGTVLIVPPASWSALAGDVSNRDRILFKPTQIRAANAAIDTGLRLHRGTSACPNVDITLRNTTHLELRQYTSSAATGSAATFFNNIRMQNNNAQDRRVGVQFRAGATLTAGRLTLTLIARANASCTDAAKPRDLTVAYELEIRENWPWRTQGQDNLSTQARLAVLALNSTDPVPTGLRVHRDSLACQSTDVALASGSPAYMKLRKYQTNGTADGSAARSLTGVAMPGSGAADRHVRVTFDGNTNLSAGTTLRVTLTVTPNSSCTGRGHPPATQLVGTVAMVAAEAWSELTGDVDDRGRILFRPSAIRSSNAATDTGLRFHRGTSVCRNVDVTLRNTTHLELRQYTSSAATGSAATFFTNVRMQNNHAQDRRVGVQFRAGATLTPGPLRLTLIAEANASCTNLAKPLPLTLAYTLSVYENWPLRNQNQDNLGTEARLPALSLTGVTGAIPTGLRLHRDIFVCSTFNVALANNTPSYVKLRKYRSNGTADGAAARIQAAVNMSGSGAADRHVRVAIDGGTSFTTLTTLHVTMTVQSNISCRNESGTPATYEVVGTVAVVPPASWSELAGDVDTRDRILFKPTQIRAANAATDTGLRLHRGTSACPNVDVTLRNTTHLELRQYTSSAATGSAATFFNNIRMQNNHASDRRVGVQFRAGATVTAGPFTLTLIARANASCTDAAKPRDLTLAYTLSVLENWPQRNQGQDNLGTQARLPLLSLEGVTGAIPTGLRLHRNIFVCTSFDVALANGTPSYVKLRKYQNNGNTDGAAARSLTGVAMPGSGSTDRHVRVAIDGGTSFTQLTTLRVTMTLSTNSSCASQSGAPASHQLVGTVAVVPPAAWSALAGDVLTRERSLFQPALIRSSNTATDTGLRLHRGTSACPNVNVTLRNTTHLELRQYTSTSATGSAATFFNNIRMQNNNAQDRRVGVQFRAGATLTAGPYALTLIVSANDSCTDAAKPRPLTLAYTLSVENGWPLRNQSQDNLGTQAQLPALSLSGVSGVVPTGLRLHRNIFVCTSFDVALANATPSYVKLRKYQTNGTADGAAARSLTGVAMPGSGATDRHVRVVIDGGTSFTQRTTLPITMTLSTNSSCHSQSGGQATHQQRGTVVVVPPASWSELAGDVDTLAQTLLFQPTQVRSSNAAIDTGLRLHRGTSACPNVDVTLRNTTHLELRQYTSTAATGSAATFFTNIRMQNNNAQDRRVGVQFRAGATLTAGRLTLTLIARANASCTDAAKPRDLTVAYELEVRENWPWRTQGQDNLSTQARLAAVALSAATGELPTGLRVHRDSLACQSTDVALATNTPNYVKLRKYRTNGATDGAAARSLTGVAMSGSGAADRHVRVTFDGGTNLAVDTTLRITLTVTRNSSCTGQGHPPATQLVGTVAIVAAEAWAALAGDVANRDRILFKPSVIGAANSATDTGLRFHRGTTVCPDIDVTLRNTTHLELRQYTSSAATGSAATFFRNLRMQNNHANDRRVGVQFRAGATLTAGPLTLTLIAEANSSCTNPAKQLPLTIAYTLSVQEDWPLRNQGQDNLGTQARLPALSLSGVTGAIPTGLRLHRNIFVCSSFDVALANGTPSYVKLRKYQNNGNTDGAAARSLTGVAMPGTGATDRHVRIAIDGGTSFTQQTTLPITMTLSTNSSCANQSGAPASHQLVGTVLIVPPASWSALAGDVSNRDRILFKPTQIRAANAAIDTGLRLHRGTSACPNVDITLRNTTHLELRQYTSSAATGSAATFFNNIRMQNNNAQDRRVGVQFRAGATVTAGPFTLTLIARANASCTDAAKPRDLTLAYTLSVLENWPQRNQGQDNLGTQARLPALSLEGVTGAIPTGLRLHRNIFVCTSFDVALANGTPSYVKLRKYQTNGTADGSAARSLTNVAMPGSGATDRHVRIAIDGGTSFTQQTTLPITMTMSTNSSCASQSGAPVSHELVGRMVIVPPAAWSALTGDVLTRERILFQPSLIRSSNTATDTGLRLHRGTSACPNVNVTLRNTTHLELRQYTSTSATGSAATFFNNIRMQNNNAQDRRVGVQFRAGATLTAGPYALTLIVSANDSCTDAAKPRPLTLAYTLSVENGWPLRNQSQDNLGTQAQLPALSLSGVSGVVPTGLRLHRNIFVCTSFDVALANGTPNYVKLGKYQTNGTADGAAARSLTGVAMSGSGATDRHVRIAIDAGTSFTTLTTLRVTMTLSTNSSCANQSGAPASHQLVGAVEIVPPAAWSALAGDVPTLARTLLFQPTQVRSSNAAIDTGLRLHRGTAPCPNVDVTLRNTTHLELRKYNGSTADGSAATFFTNIRMQASHTSDRRVGVQFRAGATLTAGRLTLTLIANANTSCTDAAKPRPLTIAYELEVRENWPWRTQGRDNLGTQARLASVALETTGAVPTGLRVHRDSLACQSTNVALAQNAPSYMKLLKYRSNGTVDGVATRSQTGVNMSGSGANDRYVEITFDGGTDIAVDTTLIVTMTITPNSSCTGRGHPPATQVVGTVVVVEAEPWNTLAGDVANRDRILFRPSAIRSSGSATDTGLRFHRGTTVCPDIDVTLRNTAHLELRQYTSSAATGSAATFFRNLRMQNNHANDRRIGVQFRGGANVPAGPLTLTLIAEANASCTNPAKQLPVTLAYTLEVREDWLVRNQGQDNLGTQARLPALSLSGVSGAVPTGLRLHRNILVCSSFDVALASNAPSYLKLRKYQANGNADGAAARSLTGVAMPGSGAADRHVRIAIDGGTSFTTLTTLRVTMTLSTNSSCANQSGAPASHQVVATVAVVPPASWSALAGDVDALAQTLLFQPSQVRSSNAAIDTGLRLHRGTSACPNVDVTLRNTTHLELRQYTSSAATGSAATFFTNIRMQNNHASDRRVGVQFRAGATLTAGRLTLTLIARANASCTDAAKPVPLTLAYTLVVLENWPWRTQGRDNLSTQARVASVALETTGPVPTGLRVHRDSLACQSTDVALASGSPAYMKLRKYRSNDTADGSEARTQTGVNMSGSGSNNRYVGITFDGGTDIAVDTTLIVTMTITPNSSCTGRGHPPATQVVGTVVVVEAEPWQTLAGDVSNRDRILFRPSRIRSSGATDTGLRFHRSTSVCPDIDVTLRNTEHLELRQYTSSAATGAAATFFRNVRMQANHANDRRVGVQFRGGANVPAGPLTLTLVAEANASCTHPAKQLPLTLAYTLEVREDWPVRNQGQDNLSTQARLAALSLSAASGAVQTGLRLHRNILVCSNFDVALAAGAPSYLQLRKYQANGTADGAAARSLTNVAMPGSGAADRHVRVAIDGGTSFAALTTLQVTMILSTNSSCANQSGAPASHQVVGTVVVVPPQAWSPLAGDVAQRDDTLFRPSRILASNAAIDTGLRFHRGTEACPDVDVTLNNTAHLELRQYTSSAATGSAATFFRNLRMKNGEASDRRVGVQFRAGATVASAPLTLTLVARAASGCTALNAPAPLTMSYTLAALERWPWRTQAQDSFAAPASVYLSALATTGAVPTGLRVHRNSPACSSVDVALAAGSPSYLSLQRHSAAGVADGAATRSLTAVNMAGTGSSARHAQVMIAGGTTLTTGATVMVSLSIAPNASCSTAEGVQAAADLVGSILVLGRGQDEITQESIQAGNAMAMRMMGLETLDAVLARGAAGSGAAATEQLLGMLAAKEAGLESGDIDLREFLAGQSFELAATARPGNAPAAGAAVWGRAAAFKTASTVSAATELESELFSAHFGADYRWSNGVVLGLGLGRHELEGTYKEERVAGSYQLELDLYQPYAVMPLGPAGWLAAYGSQGSGEIMLAAAEDGAADTMHEADYIGWGLGWRNDLDDLRMRASASGGDLEAALDDEMALDSKAGVVRLGVAYVPSFAAIPVRPELEAAWSKDWGDAQVGQHWLLGLGLEYAGDGPLQARAAYQHAVAGDGDLAGLELDFRFLPGRGGLGLSFALRPGYGLATGAAVFDQVAQPFAFDGGDDGNRRLRAEMAWGLPVSGGVLTPYSDWSVDGESDKLGAGLRLGTGAAGAWQLGWQREASSSLLLQLRIGD